VPKKIFVQRQKKIGTQLWAAKKVHVNVELPNPPPPPLKYLMAHDPLMSRLCYPTLTVSKNVEVNKFSTSYG